MSLSETDLKNESVFVVGYTGETGKELTKQLIQRKLFKQIVLVGRRKVEDPSFDDSVVQKQIDFENIDKNAFNGCSVGFCCLGTTKGKSGKDGFYKVDHDYVCGVANAAKETGCKFFGLVSSQGANANSMFFYMKTKGQVEEEIEQMGFERFSVYRPSFLLCDRQERRLGEKIALCAMKPIIYMRPTAASIPVPLLSKVGFGSRSRIA